MKTIKIIDLLNKIANEEKIPKEIKILSNNEEFELDKYINDYKGKNGYFLFGECLASTLNIKRFLNDEVEIIEEEKEIEKIDISEGVSVAHCAYKINELIDVVNEIRRGN